MIYSDKEKEKNKRIYISCSMLYKKISDYFEKLDADEEPNDEPMTILAFINQLQKDLNKLLSTPYAYRQDIQIWIADCDAYKVELKRREYQSALENAIPWLVNTYNSYCRSIRLEKTRISSEDAIKFNSIITRLDNLEMNKNIILRIARKQMSGKALFNIINSILFNTNEIHEGKIMKFHYSLNESFYNPFDTDENNVKIEDLHNQQVGTDRSSHIVKNVKLWNNNKKNKVYYNPKEKKVFASTLFAKDDIVEECPVKLLSTKSLYSEEVRSIAFEVDPEHRLYGIPSGLANHYRNSEDAGVEGNIDFEYDPKEGIIKIYALRKIYPKEELIFKVEDDSSYVNALKKNQFRY